MANRIYTGIAGLAVHKQPVMELSRLYSKILRHLDRLPKESQYRTITENFVKERKAQVESCTTRDEVEKKIGAGLCEEMIDQANAEIKLIDVMEKYKPWEPLAEKPPANQWKWPL